MAGDKKEGSPGAATDPPSRGEGKSRLSKAETSLTSLEQRILESAIRGAVPRLVGAGHAELSMDPGAGEMPSEIDFHLHPELDPKARELPGTEKAISYRAALTQALIQADPRGHREMIEELQRKIAAQHGYEIEEHSLVLYVRKKR